MHRVGDEVDNDDEAGAWLGGRCLLALAMFLIAIVPVAQIAKAVGPSTPACPGATYSVVSGDSWSLIASRAKVKMSALLTANGATTATVIHPGQTVCLPGDVVNSAPTTVPATTTTTTTPAPAATPAGGTIDFFPVQGPCSYADTYQAPRGGGRVHEGVDVIAKSGQWIYAVKDGTLSKQYLNSPGSLSGNGWRLTLADGTYFFYAHLSAFAPGLGVGSSVKGGQIIGQVGMTGNAPIPHLHFEVHPGGGASINPTPVVKAVDGCKSSAVPAQPGPVPAPAVTTPTTPAPTVPAPTVPATTTTVPSAPVTTVPPLAHRRDATGSGGTLDGRPRR